MDCSRVIENLDSLWFFTNIFTDQVPSFTHQLEEASIESPKRDDECESQKKVFCHKCGVEVGLVKENSEVVRKSGKEKEKKERRSMKSKRNEAEVVFGGFGLGFEVDGNGFLCATQMPPMDDVVAMKQHLKSWAYAVACIGQIKLFGR